MDHSSQHTIVVVAKCPIPGKSKTRLQPLLGEEGSSKLAKAMLSDVLLALSECEPLQTVRKILFYAPANQQGLEIMSNLLEELQLTPEWMLLPMTSTDLTATNLGDILTNILKRTRELPTPGKVLFLGMDSPELPLEELIGSISVASDPSEALLCPANDGGCGMLAVPPQAPTETVFAGIRWSNPLTALGQLKVLTDHTVPVKLGRMMNDIDEPEDVKALCKRLSLDTTSSAAAKQVEQEEVQPTAEDDVLLRSSPSAGGAPQTGQCRHTRQVLKDLKLLS